MVMEVMLGKRNSFASENFFNFSSLRVFRDLKDFFSKKNIFFLNLGNSFKNDGEKRNY